MDNLGHPICVAVRICESQHKLPADKCEAGLTKAWDIITQKECEHKNGLPPVPELLCDLVKSKDTETAAVKKMGSTRP